MVAAIVSLIDSAPRRLFFLLAALCACMLAFGLYLQLRAGLNPCPMCIVQRYAVISVGVLAALVGSSNKRGVHLSGTVLLIVASGFGAFVAARQSWLQWYPPEVATCGRDFYGMIESFPLNRAIPMIFRGSGDCAKVDWTFLGGSLANWSFVCFVLISMLMLSTFWRLLAKR